jgi:glycoside/pentoside/hexuronide:cation symporter, GPH family
MSARLPFWSRLLYSCGALGGNAISRSRDLWLLFFYTGGEQRLAPLAAVGAALTLVRVIEAFDDPLIGYWSDRTRTRWGRRIPFVLAATPFMALCFVFIWMPPEPAESMRNVLYLFFALSLYHCFSTLSGGPFESLLPEIAPRHEDRLSIASMQVMFGVVGAALAFVGSGLLVDRFGFVAMAIIMAVVALVARLVGLSGAWRHSVAASRELPVEEERPGLLRSVLDCFRNRQFVVFVPSQVLYSIGVQLMVGVLPFYVTAVLGREKPGTMVAMITGTALGVLVLAVPLIVREARRRSKREVYRAGMLLASLYFPTLFFIGFVPGIPREVQIIGFAALLGLPMAPVQTFPSALIADICDYHRLRTGRRSEAMFYAVQETVEKTAGATAPAVLTLLLLLGSTADNPTGIRLVGICAGLVTFAGYLCFRGYWLPDEIDAESVTAAEFRQSERQVRSQKTILGELRP